MAKRLLVAVAALTVALSPVPPATASPVRTSVSIRQAAGSRRSARPAPAGPLAAAPITAAPRTTAPPHVPDPTTPALPSAAVAKPPVAVLDTTSATSPSHVAAAATTVPLPTSCIAPLPNLPAPPSTLPLATKPQSAHVSPLFADLSIAGFAVVVLLLALQWVLTRPGRRGRRTI